ncbi:YaiO family outer membrane beta-barrel protein [Mesonia sp. K7]|uniref:YaiO family outer membrane beta-barrel protein n=1 Tax=Mesonia sp. K7 TaxID=2218606 RepID=UPI000DAA19AD|nr:YaiO family outer membrane beta-barrel protein [Mesonia sp. K7]PZD79469.1 hypothetical protein DNG35_00210 [Mesonia sp. K7]
MKKAIFAILFLVGNIVFSQINTDSLLIKSLEDYKEEKYELVIKQSHTAIKVAPDYLDFYQLLGRTHQSLKQTDSARYYYKYVIDRNTAYQASFTYLANLEIAEENYEEAHLVLDKAIETHPEEKDFQYKKYALYQIESNYEQAYEYGKELSQRNPQDQDLTQELIWIESKFKTDRIGLNYSLTLIDRENVGPWHLPSIQYIRERSWGSLIGRVSYANRFFDGASIIDGFQYELESYVFMGKEKKNYSYGQVSYSPDIVFPEWQLGYSYYHNFNKGWETELGIRYRKIKTPDDSFVAGVAGLGKYIGSYWVNLRGYFLNYDSKVYPAITLTTRCYMNTRYDYATIILGYGSSPDERSIQGLINQRLSASSYRAGLGYFRLLGEHYVIGIQGVYNNQEYIEGETQNELELFTTLQYKF